MRLAGALLALSVVSGAAAQSEPQFHLPVRCEVGRTCYVQNHVDIDPSPAARDFSCGSLTYDGHNGTDFRLPDMAAQRSGVDVLAAAPGRVLRVRANVPDQSVRLTSREAVQGAECGNGLVIDHGAGWETQYCHMARSSIPVRPGHTVEAGQVLGRVGLSGLTEYPHLHFTVRQDGKVIDPFSFGAPAGSCGEGGSLWAEAVADQLRYKPTVVLNFGFTDAPPSLDLVEEGSLRAVTNNAPALIAYVRVIGLRAGDTQQLTLRSPSGRILAERSFKPVERHKAQSLAFVGRRRPATEWEKGRYEGVYAVRRNGDVVVEARFQVEMSGV